METFLIEKDIHVLCVRASSFPGGVEAAHQKLHALTDGHGHRRFFGISFPNKEGVILYQAAAEGTVEEAADLGCDTFMIRKGPYISLFIKDYYQDTDLIGSAFKTLLAQPGLDPQGYCLEMYTSARDVRCMVGLKQS